jgi:hypothetical protein
MKKLSILSVLCVLCVSLFNGCGTAQSLVSNQLAQSAVTSVAQYYGGAKAGEFAAAGLSAAAEVMQGYVDKKPPLQVAANSPGIKGVSQIVVDYLRTKGWITQQTVDNLHAAAQIAANATPPAPPPSTGP